MDYIMIERTVYDAMVAALKECRRMLATALCRLSNNSRQEWIDNHSAQGILRRSQRSMTTLRAEGKIGYTLIEGKVFYPADEIGRFLNDDYEKYGCEYTHADERGAERDLLYTR